MDYGFEHFAPQTLSLQDLSQIPVPVTDGEEACVYIKQPEAPTLLLSPYDEVRLEYSLPSCLKAPIQTDVPTGEITVSVNGTAQQKIPLYPQKSIQETTWEDIALQMIQLFVAF